MKTDHYGQVILDNNGSPIPERQPLAALPCSTCNELRRDVERVMAENQNLHAECLECEGTGKRSFYECDDLVPCVDCNGTGTIGGSTHDEQL